MKVPNNFAISLKKLPHDQDVREWFRQAVSVTYELMCASLSAHYYKIVFEEQHDFFLEGSSPAEVKTIFSPVERKHSEKISDYLNSKLSKATANIKLKRIIKDLVKIPEIMQNNLIEAIDRQQGKVVFLNLILENLSDFLTFFI